ncbi:aliphatic sulfonate ABC transporter substrate-binding protein [Roseomonas gilardii subsp. gilardii]|uniref:aliphatic sulfonate ABC transporter substrate-binding protein n=1 Tax=Roseomonas gilardii TaxID=257708 RepID=UPI001FFAAEFA|nr:aliphatic sulfonate ABC transporter substrate-binding protein [Roseomonas gilardii]UPG73273.1 aliphatic sulfonate ABC transporter substrate-binding protein [Roseomonas gilardii subsp. gilardii]
MQPTRRHTLLSLAALGCAGLAALPRHAQAAPPAGFHIGYQKIGLLVVARQQHLIEQRLAEPRIPVTWSEFAAGPPLLEALNAGSIDFGYTGDAPPIFAQSAGAELVYVAATPPTRLGEAIIVRESSPIRSLAELKGRRVGFTRGSSSHNLTVAALEKAGLAYGDITPVLLPPADAAAAFGRGDIDAWTIWDPFLALAQAREPVRILASAADVAPAHSFLLARRAFAEAYPQVIVQALEGLKQAAAWAEANRGQVAAALAEITGVEIKAQTVAAERTDFGILPLSDEIVAKQQATADRFLRLGLIRRPIQIRDAVWTPPRA